MNWQERVRDRMLTRLGAAVGDSTDQPVLIERLTPDPVTGLGVEPYVPVTEPAGLCGRIMTPGSFYSPFRSGPAASAEWSEEQPRILQLPFGLAGVAVDLRAGDRVSLNGDTYYVIQIMGGSSWELGLQASVQLNTPTA